MVKEVPEKEEGEKVEEIVEETERKSNKWPIIWSHSK